MDMRKILFPMLVLFLLMPLGFSATTSTSACLDNQTLRETNYYSFVISGNTTDDVNFTQTKDTFCEFGCVTTSNITALCQPSAFDSNLMIGAIVVGVIVFLILIFIAVKRL